MKWEDPSPQIANSRFLDNSFSLTGHIQNTRFTQVDVSFHACTQSTRWLDSPQLL